MKKILPGLVIVVVGGVIALILYWLVYKCALWGNASDTVSILCVGIYTFLGPLSAVWWFIIGGLLGFTFSQRGK